MMLVKKNFEKESLKKINLYEDDIQSCYAGFPFMSEKDVLELILPSNIEADFEIPCLVIEDIYLGMRL